MKKIFKQSILALLFISTVACTSVYDDELTIIAPSKTPELMVPASGTIFVLDKTKPTDLATTLVWNDAKYDGIQTEVTYNVEMAKAGTNFAAITVVSVTTNDFKTLTVAELNTAALNTGLVPLEVNNVDIRIKSYVGVSGIPQYSNVSTIKITPYASWANWGIIGSATPTGWASDTNLSYSLTTKKYSITMNLVVGEFKFRLDDAWTVNYGDNGNNLSLEDAGANIPVTVAGNYTIVVDFAAKKYTITKN